MGAAQLPKVAAAFLRFLEEASLFYRRLVMQLQAAYGNVGVKLELPATAAAAAGAEGAAAALPEAARQSAGGSGGAAAAAAAAAANGAMHCSKVGGRLMH